MILPITSELSTVASGPNLPRTKRTDCKTKEDRGMKAILNAYQAEPDAMEATMRESGDGKDALSSSLETMKNKEYLHELARLHVELVHLQEWVKSSGAKVC